MGRESTEVPVPRGARVAQRRGAGAREGWRAACHDVCAAGCVCVVAQAINTYIEVLMRRHRERAAAAAAAGAPIPAIYILHSHFYAKLTEDGYGFDGVRRWSKRLKVRWRVAAASCARAGAHAESGPAVRSSTSRSSACSLCRCTKASTGASP